MGSSPPQGNLDQGKFMFKALRARWQALYDRWHTNEPEEDTGALLSPTRLEPLRQLQHASLPAPLLEAFSPAPLAFQDPRYVGREAALESLEKAIAEWREGTGRLSVLVGPPGSGLTSTLNQLRQLAESVTYLSLPQRPCSNADVMRLLQSVFALESAPKSTSAAIDTINALPPRLILLDDGHMLLARKMGNGAALQTLGAVLLATQQRHCWVLACARQAWRRLCFMYACHRLFWRVVEIDFFTEAELTQSVDARLYGLGYQWQARLGLTEGERDPLAAHFRRLHDHAEGHPQLAYFLLLQALSLDEAGQSLSLDDIPRLDISGLKACSDEELFSLAEIHTHGGLERVEHETLFRLAPDQSLVRLEQLRQQGLLIRYQASYRLAPLMVQATVQHLVNANRLY